MRIKLLLISLLLGLVSTQVNALESIKHWQTTHGGEVYFVASPGLPMVDIRMTFAAGSARDGKHEGIASLTSSLLETGAGQWNTDQLAQVFDALGAQYSFSTTRDYSWFGLRSLTQANLLAPAVNTFQKILSLPQFAPEEFQRIKQQRLIVLKQQQEKPGFIAQRNFYHSIYGQHPYAHLEIGDTKSIKAIQVADIKQFYQQYYVRQNAVLAIVGDLTEQQARIIAEDLFEQIQPGTKANELPKVKLPDEGNTESIDFPSAQTHILAGLPVLTRKDADYFPLYVGNHILGGGGLVSKLFGEIREKRGLAYSAYSYFSPLAQAGPFTMGLQTQNKKSSVALKILLKTLNEFITNGPTPEELIAAQKNLSGGFVLRFDNNRKLLNYVAMIGFYKLPLDYLDSFSGKISGVTVEQIQDAFQRRINPDLVQIIRVGRQ